MPAILGKDPYKALAIQHGDDASLTFYNMMFKDKTSEKESAKIRADLEKYCGLDTEGMVWIVREKVAHN